MSTEINAASNDAVATMNDTAAIWWSERPDIALNSRKGSVFLLVPALLDLALFLSLRLVLGLVLSLCLGLVAKTLLKVSAGKSPLKLLFIMVDGHAVLRKPTFQI